MIKKRSGRMLKYLLAVGLCIFLTGCGSQESYDCNSAGGSDKLCDAYPEENFYAEESEEAAVETGLPESVSQTGRKLIKTANLYVETREFDELYLNIQTKIQNLNGYIEKSNLYNGNSYFDDSLRSASLTVRIPNDKTDSFIIDIKNISNVTSCDQSVEDVTLNYCDLESRKKALRTEQDRLIQLLDNADSVEDIITIEGRLSQVRYEIENMESQLRTMDNQIDYSTVYIDIREVEKLTPADKVSVWFRIKDGFIENARNVLNGFKEFFVRFIIELPNILTAAAVAALIVFVLVKFAKRRLKKNSMHKKVQKQDTEE